jgi:hypothetical protein
MSEAPQEPQPEKKTTKVNISKPRPGKLRATVIRKVCCRGGR